MHSEHLLSFSSPPRTGGPLCTHLLTKFILSTAAVFLHLKVPGPFVALGSQTALDGNSNLDIYPAECLGQGT